MNIAEVWERARKTLYPYCKVCPQCNGKACAGQVPGAGGVGRGSSFQNNYNSLSAIKLNMKVIHNKIPSTNCKLLDIPLEAPFMVAPIAGVSYNYGGVVAEQFYASSIVEGALAAGVYAMTGDGLSELEYQSGVDAIKKVLGKGIPIMKPMAHSVIEDKIAKAEAIGCSAIGIDVDGAGLIAARLGLAPKDKKELSRIVSSTKLSFILKGIMTIEEAEMAVEIGAKAIVVSNHGGRVLDGTPGTCEVLPSIAKAVGKHITVLVDGGIRSGTDVFKMLALGADGVLIGRPVAIAACGGAAVGVELLLNKYKQELAHTMLMTGYGSIDEISEEAIYQ